MPDSSPLIGRTISHYRIVGKLGAGGMGEVYRAWDERLKRDVALKILQPYSKTNSDAQKDLLREAQSASALNDPHICTIYEVSEAGGDHFIVMELVEGKPLNSLIPAGGLRPELVLRYGAQIAAALAHAHDHGVIHRDIKTANVVITPAGQVKILDFGLARFCSDTELADATRSNESAANANTIVGTLPYIAPEILRGEQASARSDIWSLGVVLFEMCIGNRPFRGNTGFEVTSGILREPLPPLPPQAPAGLQTVIERCLEKEPGHRYQRAGEICAALEAVQTRPDTSSSSSVVPSSAIPSAAAPAIAAKRSPRIPVIIALAVLVVIVVALFAANVGALRRRIFHSASAMGIHSLAVLPLENLSGDAQQQYFADGMTEELTTALSQVSALRVVSRTSAMRYKGTQKSVPQIARELNVDAVVEGSVEREGDRVRITAQLIQGPSDTHLWAKGYERDLRDSLRLQDEVAQAIVDEIQLKLTPQEQAHFAHNDSVDPEAHEDYLRGLFHLNLRNGPDERQAIELFQSAIKKDPSYAAAYAALADSYRALIFNSNVAPADVAPLSMSAARRALELDDRLAEAHICLASGLVDYDWDWKGAEKEYQTALRLNPNSALAHSTYAHFLRQEGKLEESIREGRRGIELDPVSAPANFMVSQSLYEARRYDEAISQLHKSLDLEPRFWPAHVYLGKTLAEQGQFPEALEELKKAGKFTAEPDATMGYIYGRMGRGADAHKVLKDLQTQSKSVYIAPSNFVKVYIGLGDKEQAFAWLEKGYQQHDFWLTFLTHEPVYDSLRSDPRFQELVRRIGFPQ
jgi:serine/threonine protein kinase/tetratricopeptide (TPR) repeat protein